MKKTIEEVRDWLLENRVDIHGDLDLTCLDFSEFVGDVYIDKMKVIGDLSQTGNKVQGNLFQGSQKVQGDLIQDFQNVQGDLFQGWNEVQGNYFSRGAKVNGDIVFEKPTKMLKKITLDELKEMGYELTEDY